MSAQTAHKHHETPRNGLRASFDRIRCQFEELKGKKHVMTIPNMITTSRILASPVLGIAIAYDMKALALGGCVVFAFSDWLDGYLAKKLNQMTVLGAFLDPLADKFMIGSLTVGLLYKDMIPLPLAVVIIGRDVALVGMSFWKRQKERPVGMLW